MYALILYYKISSGVGHNLSRLYISNAIVTHDNIDVTPPCSMVLDTKGGDVELMKGKRKAQVTGEKDAGGGTAKTTDSILCNA